ncbi:TPA: type I pullulanase [Candidatus Avacholeplasma faecigallinarum]|nr:type I pullulanase [Candidatus Avacholeplasma faecigallinarum]
MLERMKAFIDSFETITILVDKNIRTKGKSFYLLEDGKKKKLDILQNYEEYEFYKYIVKNIPNLLLNKEYYIIDNEQNKCLLKSGSIIRTKEFDEKFSYDGPLGFEYSKDKTIFRVWTPVAKQVEVEIWNKNEKMRLPFVYKDRGLWECEVSQDLDGYAYLLYVRVFEDFKCICDPYAISSSSNGEYNYVIDINKLYKLKNPKPQFSGVYTDAIIYEASVRDFTYYLNNENQGTFMGLIENYPTKSLEPTGLSYISSLGITHLQLLPIFDFGGVDDIKKNSLYNWGYNPEQYFVPSGWYSKRPDDPYSRLNELLQFIDECHRKKIRVNMDVVFNHVYKIEEFPFDYLVPGYAYRVDEYGKLTNSSFCGNDFATERYMCSKFVVDVLKYYAKVFQISGFRFDLMGLLDIETLNKAYEELKTIDDGIMVYGEGWNMQSTIPDNQKPHMYNHNKIPQYAFFNDRFRDIVRGNQFKQDLGYAFGGNKSIYEIYHLNLGSCLDYFKFQSPTQSINYVECHDNYTMYDFGKTYLRLDEQKVLDGCRLALEMILVSQGIPFIHAGEEFFRTKQGVENSYDTKDSINKIDYSRRDKFIRNVQTIRELISLRKKYDVLRRSDCKIIKNSSFPLEGLIDINTFAILLECQDYQLGIIIKNSYEQKEVEANEFIMVFDGYGRCHVKQEKFTLTAPGVYLFEGVKNKWN